MNKLSNEELMQLIEKLKMQMYDTKLGVAGVLSTQFFHSIGYSMFDDVPFSENPYTFTFGDVDGLGKLNINEGSAIGDLALQNVLLTIRSIMPEGTIIFRIAGDEFAFITPSFSRDEVTSYTNKINEELKKRKDTHGLSITLASMDNSTYTKFHKLYAHTELDVNEEKGTSKTIENLNPRERLTEEFLTNIRRFFDYYRFKGTELPPQFIANLKMGFLNTIIADIEAQPNDLEEYRASLNNTLSQKKLSLPYLKYNRDAAQNIYKLLTTEDSPQELLDQINQEDLLTLFDYLNRHPLTHQFSQKYFTNILAPQIINGEEKQLKIHIFEPMHMKLSNDMVGHNETDQKMIELHNNLIEPIKTKNPNAIFVMKGPSLILIENIDEKTPDTDISEIVSNATSKKKQLLLGLAHGSITCDSADILDAIEALEKNCSEQKQQIKADKMTDVTTINLALSTALKPAIEYYKEQYNTKEQLENRNSNNNQYMRDLQENFIRPFFDALTEIIIEKFGNLKATIMNEKNEKTLETPKNDFVSSTKFSTPLGVQVDFHVYNKKPNNHTPTPQNPSTYTKTNRPPKTYNIEPSLDD